MRIYFLVGSRMQDKQLKCSYLMSKGEAYEA
jgi:hypothetical protein